MTATPRLTTARLTLDPLRIEDARQLAVVFADPGLYAFIGGEPPSAAEVDRRCRAWVAGSPRQGETWHNWVVRLGVAGPVIGHLQATVLEAGGRADIAWLIIAAWQGRGYASEGARAVVAWLDSSGIATITAHIAPKHEASGRVAAAAGLERTDMVEDGEVVWRRERAQNAGDA